MVELVYHVGRWLCLRTKDQYAVDNKLGKAERSQLSTGGEGCRQFDNLSENSMWIPHRIAGCWERYQRGDTMKPSFVYLLFISRRSVYSVRPCSLSQSRGSPT